MDQLAGGPLSRPPAPMVAAQSVTKVYPLPPRWLRLAVRVAARQPIFALRDVSFTLDRGEILGLVGPNGAGKTTLIRILGTLLEPTSGQVQIDGIDLAAHPLEVNKRVGLVLEGDRGLYVRLTGQENLEFFGVLFGLTPPVARQRAGELMEFLDLAGRDKLVFGYSSGMRTRLCVARALISDPSLIILDEPTRSLDPVATQEVGGKLRKLADDGRAVLLSSHRLDEVVTICDRVLILVDGVVRFFGHIEELSDGERSTAAAKLASLLVQEDNR